MRILVVCTTDSMIWNFLIPYIKELEKEGHYVECASSITGEYFYNLQKQYNIKMNEIKFERSPYKLKNITAYKNLINLIKEKNFDTVFCHEPVGGALGRLAGKYCKCKVIYMTHGFHFFKGAPLKNWIIYYNVEKILSKKTDVLITINTEDYDIAKNKFFANKVYMVHGVGVNKNKFDNIPLSSQKISNLKKELNIKEKDFSIFYVAELIKRKNQIMLIDAMKDIVIKDNNIKVFLVGDGVLTKYYKRKIKKLNLQENVFMLGYRKDISDLFKISNLCVSTSLQEGLGINLIEAAANSVPLLASKIRGHNEIIKENINGLFFENKKEMIEIILKLASNDYILEKFRKNCRNSVKEFFLENTQNEIIKIFKENI